MRDLGATGEGTHHFWYQRLTALLNSVFGLVLILSFRFTISGSETAISESALSELTIIAWLTQPLILCFFLIFLLSTLWHMRLGMDMVIDDYIASSWLNFTSHICNLLFTFTLAIIAILALIKIVLNTLSP